MSSCSRRQGGTTEQRPRSDVRRLACVVSPSSGMDHVIVVDGTGKICPLEDEEGASGRDPAAEQSSIARDTGAGRVRRLPRRSLLSITCRRDTFVSSRNSWRRNAGAHNHMRASALALIVIVSPLLACAVYRPSPASCGQCRHPVRTASRPVPPQSRLTSIVPAHNEALPVSSDGQEHPRRRLPRRRFER